MQPSNDKASSGQPFRVPPAEVWNGMVDAGNAYRAGLLSTQTPDRKKLRRLDVVHVKNDSGADRSRGEILRFTDKALEDLEDEFIWLVGGSPTDDGFFGILKDPIEDQAVGVAQVSGCCLALVDVADASHTHAAPASGDYVLASGSEGPLEILYKPSGTGELECVVRFGARPSNVVHFVSPSGGIPARSSLTMGSATCDIYQSSSAGVLSDSGQNKTIYNIASAAFAGSTHGVAALNDAGLWVAIVEDCGA